MTELAYPSGLTPGLGGARLSTLRDLLRPSAVYRFRDLAIEGLATHSDDVRDGSLFFAVPGTRVDGTTFVPEAIVRGASAIVAQTPMNVSVPLLVVPDVRGALADAGSFFFDNPSASLDVVGVTGTNGKTTVAHLLRHVLEMDGRSSGLLGTVAYEFGGRRIPATNTTPDPIHLQGYLREMADRRDDACVMEVSSHSLTQARVRGVSFKAGVFLNLTQDHLDYHQSMREYALAKARLFTGLRPGSIAVLNAESSFAEVMFDAVPVGVRVVTFGCVPEASFRAEHVRCDADGTLLTLAMPNGKVDLRLPLPGRFNVENALAAAATAHALGVSELTIASALETAPQVPGRMELVARRDGIRVFVDYAHTPDALAKACATLRQVSDGRLTVVFGCGGDRDRQKRPLMARAAAEWADRLILTSDNPRTEDPEAILDEIQRGLQGGGVGACDPRRIPDRAEAIRCAVTEAVHGEIVLVAGKGHETYQIVGESVVPFDDGEEVRRAIALRGGP